MTVLYSPGESGERLSLMYFQSLQLRLIAILKGRVRSGRLTERSLARITGISQPHIHHVLKGAKGLSPEMADRLLEHLHISVFDLLQVETAAGTNGPDPERPRYGEVAVLEGLLGPGHPFPSQVSPAERYPFLHSQLAAVERPVAAWLAADERMAEVFRGGDLVLLDCSPDKRCRAEPGQLYVVARGGEACVREVRLRETDRYPRDAVAVEPARRPCISLSGDDILNIVKAKVVWIGRHMERKPVARETAQEARPGYRSAG